MSPMVYPDELTKLANKITLTREEVIGQLHTVINHRTRILTARCNTHEMTAQVAARELAAYRIAIGWIEAALPEPPG